MRHTAPAAYYFPKAVHHHGTC